MRIYLRLTASATLASLCSTPFDALAQSHLRRLGSNSAGVISQVKVAAIDPSRAVTAVRNESQSLQVITWGLKPDGSISRLHTGTAGKVDRVTIAQMGRNRVMTAVRNEAQSLEVIVWDVDTSGAGTISRVGGAVAGQIVEVTVAGLGRDLAVTALRLADGTTKLISWGVSNSGAVTRLGDAEGDAGTVLSLTALSASRVLVAMKKADGKLGVTVWSVGTTGFQRRGSASGPLISRVDVSLLSYGRFATLARTEAGTLDIRTWDVNAAGAVVLRSSATAGAIRFFALTTRAATQLIAATVLADGTLRLIDWDGIGTLTRLGAIDAGAVEEIDIVTLGTDRLFTAMRLGDNTLKVIAWRDDAVALLQSEWGPAPAARFKIAESVLQGLETRHLHPDPSQPDDYEASEKHSGTVGRPLIEVAEPRQPLTPPATPLINLKVSPQLDVPAKKTGVEGVDPMIAAGFKFLIVTQDHRIAFFDKQGVQLPMTNGMKTNMSSTEFFAGFITDTLGNGKTNENNINRHLGIGPDGAACDPSSATLPNPCINEFYDTRVVFDARNRRFVILSAARADSMTYLKADTARRTDTGVRRYFAMGVSKTEDPRDGFHLYMTTETNYSDWPRVVAQNDVVIVAHNGYQTTPKREGPKPTVYVFDMDAMKRGQLRPVSMKFDALHTGGNVKPVATLDVTNPRWNHVLRNTSSTVEMYSFQTHPDMSTLQELEHSSALLTTAPPGVDGLPVQRGQFIYLSGYLQATARVPNKTPARYSVRYMRLPLVKITNIPRIRSDPQQGFIDSNFGKNAPDDAPGDLVSYERSAMSVTKKGDMVFVYGRLGIKTAATLFPEVRYSVHYADARGLQRSRILMKGDFVRDTVWAWENDTEPTTKTYYSKKGLDYTTATNDPSGDGSIWMAHAFGDKARQSFSMVIARVTP